MKRTAKELALIKDMKDQEKLCADKFTKYADEASDCQLRELFNSFAEAETDHYNAVCSMESGEVPEICDCCDEEQEFTDSSEDKNLDTYLCSDALASQKHVSHLLDTCIFEFTDAPSRDALNKIQRNTQNQGKIIYDYMSANGMYS